MRKHLSGIQTIGYLGPGSPLRSSRDDSSSTQMPHLTLRPATLADVPHFERWDRQPHVIKATSDDPDADIAFESALWAEEIESGARFTITSGDPAVKASIRAMTVAHAATMDGIEGWSLEAEETGGGAVLTASGDATRIRALGFIGLMTVGMHHQAHHLGLARGETPH